MRISETSIFDVERVEIYDKPLPFHDLDDKPIYTKDIHIIRRDGSEIVFFCHMGPVENAETPETQTS